MQSLTNQDVTFTFDSKKLTSALNCVTLESKEILRETEEVKNAEGKGEDKGASVLKRSAGSSVSAVFASPFDMFCSRMGEI